MSGKDGKQDGVVVGYQENGQLWMKGAVEGRDTEWDGTVDEEKTGTYRDGVKVDQTSPYN